MDRQASTSPTNDWFTSSYTNGNGTCVEVRFDGDAVLVRDTKDAGTGPILTFTHAEWNAFVAGAKAGEFDQP